MLKFLKSATLLLAAGIATASALPAPASADGFTLSINENGPRFGVYVDDDSPRGGWDHGPGGWDRGSDGWERGPRWGHRPPPPPPPPRCTADRALEKAMRLGLRRVRILDIDRDVIEVSGSRFGERRIITFARAPFCPVVDW